MRPVLGVLALLAAACQQPFGPEGEPFAPPEIYAQWWEDTERCSGLRGHLWFVRWRVVGDEASYIAQYVPGDHTVYIQHPSLMDSLVVRHEMLHALLGHGRHTAEYFGLDGRCGSLVHPGSR